ncbi:MAG: hypothetical protein NTX00_05035 [Candidatus Parcubacteria bacterium]|nr:hypothetical protein [Candidatus Parcubacteria bacterium]
MSRKSMIIIGVCTISLSAVIFFYLYSYLSYWLEYKNIFPDKPKISDISNPLPIQKINLKNVNYPLLTANNSLFYLDDKSVINKVDLSSLNYEGAKQPVIFFKNLDVESVLNVKWCNETKMIMFQISAESYPKPDGDDVMPGDLQVNEINKIAIDLENKKTVLLNPYTIDAVWNDSCDLIYYLFRNTADNTTSLYSTNPEGISTNKLLLNFGSSEIGLLPKQSRIQDNFLYYYKIIDNQNVLIRLNIINLRQDVIFKDLIDAVISPNDKYAFIEKYQNNNIISIIYDIENAKIIYTFKYIILSDAITWNRAGDELYFQAGENLKMGDESKFLNRAASYVFFKYNASTNSMEQLNNHVYDNPIVPLFYILDEKNDKLYFSDFPKNDLFYLDLH